MISSRRFYVWETCEWNLSFHSSLVGEGMSGSNETTSEHSSSVHLELGNDEVYLLGYESVSDDQSSSERELSADSPLKEEGIANPSRWGYRKIVLPRIWLVNDFPPKMMKEVFDRLCPHF